MKAKELRIGNNVNFRVSNGENEVFGEKGRITGILTGYVYINGIRFELKDLQPILLTGEIMVKAGYIKNIVEDLGIWYKIVVNQWVLDDLSIFYYKNTKQYCRQKIEIKSLHQLQNLYFALTGEELGINL